MSSGMPGELRRMISTAAPFKGLHEGGAAFFTCRLWVTLCVLPGAQNLLPENNTLFRAALRTISRLLDNGISLVR
jgi:hypothetical protein